MSLFITSSKLYFLAFPVKSPHKFYLTNSPCITSLPCSDCVLVLYQLLFSNLLIMYCHCIHCLFLNYCVTFVVVRTQDKVTRVSKPVLESVTYVRQLVAPLSQFIIVSLRANTKYLYTVCTLSCRHILMSSHDTAIHAHDTSTVFRIVYPNIVTVYSAGLPFSYNEYLSIHGFCP